MKAPAPFRIAILFDTADAASRARAVALRDCLDPAWFSPELWPTARARFTGLMSLAWQLRCRRPAALYAPSSRGTNWGVVLGLLLGIPVVTDSPKSAVARLARLLGRRYASVEQDAAPPPANAPVPLSGVDNIQHILRDVLQMGSSWTTTRDGRVPMELALGTGAGASEADRIEERGLGRPDRSVRRVGQPSLTVFLPDREIATGTAIVICPGGGYAGVTIDKEGHDVARWLAAKGIAGLVLKYRLPQADRGDDTALPWPMADLDEALVVTRARAMAWGIRADRIGVMGFSAGGHMAAWASRLAVPPALAILVYPVISMDQHITHAGSRNALLGKSPLVAMVERYSFERGVTPGICPTFVVHARDDTVAKPENSFVYLEALRAANVPAKALIYDRGGHGFGLGIHGGDIANWPACCLEWIAATTAIG